MSSHAGSAASRTRLARTAVPTAGLLTGGLIIGGLLVGGAAPALAAYPPNAPVCSEATSTNTPGAPVTITGVGFPGNTVVTVGGTGVALVPVTTVTTDANGTLKVVEKLGPKPGTGQFTLSGTPTNSKCSAVSVSVKALTVTRSNIPVTKVAPTQVKGTLAFTGAEGIGLMSVFGAGLVAVGSAAVMAGRRRKAAAVVAEPSDS